MSRVSILVPSRTGAVDGLRAQLARQTLTGWELIVKRGIAPPARSRNLAAAEASGEILLFLDDDVQLMDDRVLEDVVRALEAAGPQAAMGVLCRVPADATPFQHRQEREAFAPKVPATDAPWPAVAWDVLGTACCAIARTTFEALGGFDESLRSGEDFDLWYRLESRGGKAHVLTNRWIGHYPPKTALALIRKTIWYERGNGRLARKYPNSGYRMPLRGRAQAAGYLALRTLCLVPLMFLKVSYQHRRPVSAFRPLAALLSYVGAWAYCLGWFEAEPRVQPSSLPMQPIAQG